MEVPACRLEDVRSTPRTESSRRRECKGCRGPYRTLICVLRRPNKTEDPEAFFSSKMYTDKLLQYLDERDPSKPWMGYYAFTAVSCLLGIDMWCQRLMPSHSPIGHVSRRRHFETSQLAQSFDYRWCPSDFSVLPQIHRRICRRPRCSSTATLAADERARPDS